MPNTQGRMPEKENHIDFDIHGKVGVRLLRPSEKEAAAVAKQLGPMQKPLSREPDIIIRFVEHIPLKNLRLLGLNAGFNEDGFYILRGSKKPAKVRIPFDQIGEQCEIVCESGLKSVPLLIHIVNIVMLKKNCVSLHASAFHYKEKGILVTGWAKGGKSESLLAFSQHGASYMGDEWIYLSRDGEKMYGIPENMRLWEWHLQNLPQVRKHVKRESRMMFKCINALDKFQQAMPNGGIGSIFPVKFLREAMPALKRQLNVVMPPEKIFNGKFGPLDGNPEKIFLVMSHNEKNIQVEPVEPAEIANRMIASIRFEQLPFAEHYLSFQFAFPERKNSFLDNMHKLQYELLQSALKGKETYIARHPYPFSFHELYEAMRPVCEREMG
ncbi:MAG: hypothetical protein ACE5I1_06485 [bacterium]